jgi:alpha-D-ribose 1-methylphosphonate 5-triphosphate diphosphatase
MNGIAATLGTTLAVTNVRAVAGGRILDDATIVIEGDRIASVESGVAAPTGAIDGQGLLCIPGLVDTHSDGLEKELAPRRGARFPTDFALLSYEGRVRAAGITTMFHGVGFEDEPEYGRSVELAHALCDAIGERRGGHALIDHRILYRIDARTERGLAAAVTRLGEAPADVLPVMSFEDHTPGQGQYRDIEQFKRALDPAKVGDGETVDDRVARIIAEAEANDAFWHRNLETLRALTAAGRIRLLGHDCEGAAEVDAAASWGASIAEFPVTVEAARRARERGLPVVMGAPNALRGSSHNGNVGARELIGLGLCDALASDYLPSTMLAAAFEAARTSLCSLPTAVDLVTAGPARAVGLLDRGVLEPGRLADLTLVDDAGRWPVVVSVHRAEQPEETR